MLGSGHLVVIVFGVLAQQALWPSTLKWRAVKMSRKMGNRKGWEQAVTKHRHLETYASLMPKQKVWQQHGQLVGLDWNS